MKLADLHLRDPFIVPVRARDRYYLFGTDGTMRYQNRLDGFLVFSSSDLDEWSGPVTAFVPPASFWSDRDYWAPEVHEYQGKYYMFASFKSAGRRRGTQVLRSDAVEGLYHPVTDGPYTPEAWECLDGTLHVDENGTPHTVFCHEWVQVGDGEICSLELTPDLKTPIGEPKLLFKASSHPLSFPTDGAAGTNHITDGPFLHRTADGRLLMLWATFGKDGVYTQLQSRSQSALVSGPWEHNPRALYDKDGGHAMVFRTFDGRLMMSLHAPNSGGRERPQLVPVIEKDGWLEPTVP